MVRAVRLPGNTLLSSTVSAGLSVGLGLRYCDIHKCDLGRSSFGDGGILDCIRGIMRLVERIE